MKRTKLFVWVLAAALLLCACTAKTSNSASAYPDNRDEMAVVGVNARYPAVQSQTVEHGEDYVIQWEDPAMEAHIRSVLDRPKGDILHSDVWNIQVLILRASSADGYDVALEQPTDGDSFTFEMVEMNPAVRHSYHGTAFQNLSTLADLKHFDGLQYFSYSASQPYDTLTDLSGLSVCNGLKVLFLRNVKPGSLTSLESLQNLQTLTLSNCGTLDIAPLAKLPALTSVNFYSDKLDSLEPLTELEQLSYLGLTGGTTYPGLEPLVQTNIRYLNLGVGLYDSKRYEELDYTPLSEMKSLVWLDLTHHTRVDEALCGAILESNKELKYLNISYTEAAKSGAKPKVEYLMDKT